MKIDDQFDEKIAFRRRALSGLTRFVEKVRVTTEMSRTRNPARFLAVDSMAFEY